MKINLSKPIKNLKGDNMYEEDKVGISAGRILANWLSEVSTRNSVNMFRISMELLDDKDVEVSREELKFLKQIIDEGNLSNTVKATLLIELGNHE